MEPEPEYVGGGSLFEVKSFPGESSSSKRHVVCVVKVDVVCHRPQLQTNPAEDINFNLTYKMKWNENLAGVILKGSLILKKSGFHLPWQAVLAIIEENHLP